MRKSKIAASIAIISLYTTAAVAGKWFYAQDRDQAVAIEKANLGAKRGAMSRGTCMSQYASSATCKSAADGKWECGAVFANHGSSCRSGRTVLDDVNRSIETINNLCKGREAACASVGG